jgi:hypothetical protein
MTVVSLDPGLKEKAGTVILGRGSEWTVTRGRCPACCSEPLGGYLLVYRGMQQRDISSF